MSAGRGPLSHIAGGREKLECYSGLHTSYAEVRRPTTVAQLQEIFTHATAEGRRVTIRSGGHSFDAQSLGSDLVVSMEHFDHIGDPVDRDHVCVGAGAKWGDVLRKLQPLGLVPAVTVTTEHATAGGTLSGDCLSRFSPSWGKEGKWVIGFDLVTPTGGLLKCEPPPGTDDPPRSDGAPPLDAVKPEDWTLQQQAFMATIAGLGYVGAVVAITYRLVDVGETDGKIGIRTEVTEHTSYADLADELVPVVMASYESQPDARDPTKHDAIYSALSGQPRNQQTLLFKSTFTTDPERRPMLLFRPHFPPRVLIEWAFRWQLLNRLTWWIAFRFFYRRRTEYRDDLAGYTFFMDGNVRAKEVARKLFRADLKTLQQTFVVPSHTGSEAGWDKGKNDLVEWLEHAEGVLEEHDVTPTLLDVLFLPPDAGFPLSVSAGMAGYAVTYAFETSNECKLARAKAAFESLSDILWERFGGRVYLVKNVHASQATLANMYGDNAAAFFAIKHKLDPSDVLRNEFLNRIFGDPAALES
jgi:decaprenylphospho-beta-D-ribofuranose 2-oxidase